MSNLTVNVRSFSYKKGLPKEESGNGGGYVFDCRAILNPGRIDKYKTQTGRDIEVITYLEEKTKIKEFLAAVYNLVGAHIENFLERDFTDLSVNFGCTGGQHRSVYSADRTADFIKEQYPEVKVKVTHVVQEEKNWINEPY